MVELKRDVLYEDGDFEIDSDDEADWEQSELLPTNLLQMDQ